MIYALLVTFIIIYLMYYTITRSFISPVALILLSFIFALTIVLANIDNWQVKINEAFIIYTITSVCAFVTGCFVVRMLSGRFIITWGGVHKADISNDVFSQAGYSRFIFCTIPLLCTIPFVLLMYKKAGGIGNIFRNIYLLSQEDTSNFFVHQLREIIVAIAEISVLEMLVARFINKTKIHKGFFVPLFCFALCTLFSSDRNIFLRFLIYTLCLWVFFYTSTSNKSITVSNREILKKTLFYMLIAIGLFYLLGKIKGYTSNLERMIGLYGGSGLYNFNLFLEKGTTESLQYGKVTFEQLINTIGAFGVDMHRFSPDASNLENMMVFTSPNGYIYASNVYSAMMPYVRDYGYFGVILFPFFMGFFFEKLYIAAIRMKSGYGCGIYSLLIYSVVYFAMVEQFFRRFHLGLIYELFWFSVFYYLAFGCRGRVRLRIGYDY